MYDHRLRDMARDITEKLNGKKITDNDYDLIHAILEKYWADKIAIVWGIKDVFVIIDRLNEESKPIIQLTDEEAKEILDDVLENMDCEYGVTWETIEYALDEFLMKRESDSNEIQS
jgi:hypothetical protein